MTLFPSFFVNTTGGAYEIEQSLRFNEAYLSRTPSSAGNRQTFTFSVWLKRSLISTAIGGFFGAWSSNSDRDVFRFDTNDELRIFFAETVNANIYSNAKYRDASAWYHLVAAIDTTQATAANRVKIWINGEALSFRSASYPSQNTNLNINNTVAHYIGTAYDQTEQELQGYLAEFNFIDGSALDHEDFGEPDNNGVWRPKRYTGSYGTNGFYLKFDPSATNGIGHDHSGNGNMFTPTGFTTSGTGTDVMSDTPTTNWATFYPLHGNNVSAFSNGNLDTVCNNASTSGGTIAVSSGKWYAEFVCTAKTAVNGMVGICTIDGFDADRQPNESLNGGFGTIYVMNGTYIQSGSAVSYGATWAVNDVMGVALDLDSTQNTVTFYKNGTSQGAINISNAAYVFAVGNGQGSSTVSYTANFGQRAFEYTPPTGFEALSTANLPAPDIADGSQYFNTVLYSGNGTSQSLTVGFQSDWIWTKPRNAVGAHVLVDAVRGNTKFLESNSDGEEQTRTGNDGVTSFDPSGYSIGSSGDWNASGETFVSWNWLAANGTSSNTDGSITSTVSANPTAGFSIATYSANNTAGATFGHGLGVAPSMVIIKKRNAAERWVVYHQSISNQYIYLNETFAGETANAALRFGNDSSVVVPSSTLVTIGTSNDVNGASGTYVAYCFAEVEGYSKIGSYTGNSSDDGPFVYCGFKPRFIIAKASTNSLTQWIMYDTARSAYNVADDYLQPSNNAYEQTGNNVEFDILSNGFKLRGSDQQVNTSHTYIFYAVAENPFGGDGVSPATAR